MGSAVGVQLSSVVGTCPRTWLGPSIHSRTRALIARAVRARLFTGEIRCDVAGSRRAPYRRASQAHTINCIWWNIINGTTINPAVAAGNNTLAKGNPLASDFFEPQKTIAI